MKRLSTKERFRIPLDGDSDMKFYTKSGLLLATGYERIVIGGRGPYIEFSSDQIEHGNIHIPKHAEYKLENSFSYYHEYRSNDECNVKLYDQKIGVSYADYKVGMWYIDPNLIKTDEFEDLMKPLYEDVDTAVENSEDSPNLFDSL